MCFPKKKKKENLDGMTKSSKGYVVRWVVVFTSIDSIYVFQSKILNKKNSMFRSCEKHTHPIIKKKKNFHPHELKRGTLTEVVFSIGIFRGLSISSSVTKRTYERRVKIQLFCFLEKTLFFFFFLTFLLLYILLLRLLFHTR